jgi:arginine decarboxylase
VPLSRGLAMDEWDIDEARDLYNLPFWSEGYFDINEFGHLVARPYGSERHIDLYQLAHEIRGAGLVLPVLVRFLDILRDRVDSLCGAFARAMRQDGYEGAYTAVYPIKVNQQRRVVEEILDHGGDRVGLEAGSKPELVAVLALSGAGGIVIANGYKDREYVRLALVGGQLGIRVFLVVEKLSELRVILAESRALGVEPLLGVRIRSSAIGAGKWQNTGGEKSKFGLMANEVLALVDELEGNGMLGRLQLLHFHLGSQIANIRDIKKGLAEGARYYAQLRALGADIHIVDVGGGLGVDYEGTRSRSFCSVNYNVQEYANDVVHALWQVCAERGLAHPQIITEAGRAMTAHHAMLITDVIDSEDAGGMDLPPPPTGDDPLILHDLWQGINDVSERRALEAYHDACHWLGEAQVMFTHGMLSLRQRAHAEQLYLATCRRVRDLLRVGVRAHREVLDELNERLADKYFCNFSVFQSIPDTWAIDQVFPIAPLHRLGERPTRRAVLHDLTCDSDGRIELYVEGAGVETSLPLHPFDKQNPYLVGIFMVGAYQEILGDMHNLFGDSDSVNVRLSPHGGHTLEQPRRGDTVDSVLRYVHFDAQELLGLYRSRAEAAALTPEQRRSYLAELSAGMSGYTYLED